MQLTAEQIKENWDELMGYIEVYIESPRKEKLLEFYNKYQERLIMMPAANHKKYHSAFPGGYVYHVNRVIRGSMDMYNVWKNHGVDVTTFTFEELIFSALNHDLGKMGDEKHEAYIPQTDKWRQDKLGEDYEFNTQLAFASVPDRSLFLLQSHGITYTFNEMVSIQIHDGLYDEGNKKYLMSFSAETKPRTALPFILHQADLMAARIEFEEEWLPKLQQDKKVEIKATSKYPSKSPKLSNPDAPFANLLNNI